METNTEDTQDHATEISSLGERRRAAEAEVKRAAERLEELNDRRIALAPDALSGDKEAAEELAALVAALDEESAAVSHTKTVAENAARELERLILKAEVRHREEEKRLARERYVALCKTRYSLDGEAEEAMAGLVEVLDRLESLYDDQVRTAADAEESYLTQQDPRSTIELWLGRRLRRWLPNGSFEKYDAPLPELDPLAWKPEPGGGQEEGKADENPRP